MANDLGTDLEAPTATRWCTRLTWTGWRSRALYTSNLYTVTAVCSPSRSALIAGISTPVSINAHQHRTYYKDSLPEPVRPITAYFQEAGYFVSNGSFNNLDKFGKTDYNFIHSNEDLYDGTDWRQRAAGQPFFAQVQIFYPHRPFKRDPSHPVNADSVRLPPYYPDHPIARQDWALYLKTVQHVDQEVGKVLQRLEDDGLADSTIVFFFSDRGGPTCRPNRFLYAPGAHTPLIIRRPGGAAGRTDDQLISDINLAPRAMQLAVIAVPDYVQGQSFLSPSVFPPQLRVHHARPPRRQVDRIRAVRTNEDKYIRNFYPSGLTPSSMATKSTRTPCSPCCR